MAILINFVLTFKQAFCNFYAEMSGLYIFGIPFVCKIPTKK